MLSLPAIDCTATLPLINSLNHLAYLTSTSPRIREMVCVDGGLERLIRILRQVPRTPPQPALRGVITKEMQAIWKWSLAFQCVVNIGVRGSENIRTRVVEAGMIPVAVRVLESYLRIADAIREEKKREAKREEAKQRLERAAEAALLGLPDVAATPTTSALRRGAVSYSNGQSDLQNALMAVEGSDAEASRAARPAEGTAEANSVIDSYMANTSMVPSTHNRNHQQAAETLPATHNVETVTPVVAAIDSDSVLSASSSSSSDLVNEAVERASSSQGGADNRPNMVAGYPSGLLTNVSSVEDFTASASGSDGAEDAEMEGEESEMDSTHVHRGRSAEEGQADMQEDYEVGDGATPRPPRRMLAPLAGGEARREVHPAWQAVSQAATSVTPVREVTVMATPRRSQNTIADSRGRMPPTINEPVPNNTDAAQAGRPHHHHHHHAHHHHGHRERAANQGETVLHPSDMIYREEEVLLSLQLLAYLSKYAHVRTLFHCDLSLLNSLETLDGSITGALRDSIQSWNPHHPTKKNVFCIAERYTLKSSRTGLSHFAPHGESRVAPEIQYWAGVIMRNACRKDENQGGIRQCANMLCGKWEKQPREFAKCRRCRKAKYCSKQCQSKGWQMGHRFWCSARNDDEHPDAKDKSKEKTGAGELRGDVPMEGEQADALQRRHVGVGEGIGMQQDQQPDAMPTLQAGHAHVSPPPLFPAGRAPQRVYPGEVPRRHASTSSSLTPTAQTTHGGRRVVSAIPTHLQPPSSDDPDSGGSRSRTISAASSGGEQSDMSDDEMERASRRVVANTVSPAQRSPGVSLTPLPGMTAAEEAMMLSMASTAGDAVVSPGLVSAAGMVPTRTDLAGRPLPPPVIAQHDAGMQSIGAPGDDIMAMGGGLTPGVQEEQETAVFGRGDIDQMIWRGRTPAAEDEEEARDTRRRGSTITARNVAHYRQQITDEEEEDDGLSMMSVSAASSACGRANNGSGSSSSGSGSGNSAIANAGSAGGRTLSGTPRCPSSSNLLAPVARQPHRFASVASATSPVASSSRNTVIPHSFVRGSLAGTFGDWRTSSSPVENERSVSTTSSPTNLAAAGLGLNSSRTTMHSSLGRITSAPAHSMSFDSGMPVDHRLQQSNDFIVPSEIQNLLNTVESSDDMQLDTA